jgi:hypothetical protein
MHKLLEKIGYIIKNGVDIYHSNNIVKDGYVDIDINSDYIKIYFWRDKSWRWWEGSKKGVSAKLSIIFNDKKNMITVNHINKIFFHRREDYELVKNKSMYYKLLNTGDNKIEFEKKEI